MWEDQIPACRVCMSSKSHMYPTMTLGMHLIDIKREWEAKCSVKHVTGTCLRVSLDVG